VFANLVAFPFGDAIKAQVVLAGFDFGKQSALQGFKLGTIAATRTPLTRLVRDERTFRDYNVLTPAALEYRAALVAAGALPALSPAFAAI